MAIVNEDRPVKHGDTTLTTGADMVEKLVEDNDFDWHETTREEAAARRAQVDDSVLTVGVRGLALIGRALRGALFLSHWLVVVPVALVRIAVGPEPTGFVQTPRFTGGTGA